MYDPSTVRIRCIAAVPDAPGSMAPEENMVSGQSRDQGSSHYRSQLPFARSVMANPPSAPAPLDDVHYKKHAPFSGKN